MGNISVHKQKIDHDFVRKTTTVYQNKCKSTVTQSASDNVVVIDGATVDGNVTAIRSVVHTDASCMMTSAMEDHVDALMTNNLKDKTYAANDIMNGLAFDETVTVTNVRQRYSNATNNTIDNLCGSSSIQQTNGNLVYVRNSTIKGDFVGIDNSSSSSATCSMANMARMKSYSNMHSDVAVSSTFKGMAATLVIAVIVVAAAVVGVTVLLSMNSQRNRATQTFGRNSGNPTDQIFEAVGVNGGGGGGGGTGAKGISELFKRELTGAMSAGSL